MLPKAEGGAGVIHADAKLGVREAISGLADGHSRSSPSPRRPRRRCFSPALIVGASARLEGLTWGAEDLSAELGAEANRDPEGRFLDPYRLARALCLAGAAAAQVQAIDTVTVDFRNVAALRRETEEARRDGFTGKMAIHPAQVPVINEVFTPTPAALAKARAVVAAFDGNPGAGYRRHRRGDVRSPAPRTRAATAGTRSRSGIGLMPLSCPGLRYFFP